MSRSVGTLTDPNKPSAHTIRLLTLVETHDCSYLPKRQANSVFVDSNTPPNWQQYCQLSHLGFRRSGSHYYRPQCPSCDECKSCRVRVFDINLRSKRFKRILAKSKHLQINLAPATFSAEHYALYQKYIDARHRDGDMYPPTEAQYKSFLVGTEPYNRFLEVRDQTHKLVSSSAIDFLDDGISAVYTYYDPAIEKISPGTLAVLLLCEMAKSHELDYLYLGYWVKNSQKMHYKTQYRPLEIFNGDEWQLLDEEKAGN